MRKLMEFRLPLESYPFYRDYDVVQMAKLLRASICLPLCAVSKEWVQHKGAKIKDCEKSILIRLGRDLELKIPDKEDKNLGLSRGDVYARTVLAFIQSKAEKDPRMIACDIYDATAEDLECATVPMEERPTVICSHLFSHRMLSGGYNSHSVHRFRNFPNQSVGFFPSRAQKS
jgi:hypothetical protein